MIVYAAFKGMGDLLSAAPVIARQLDAGKQIKLLLFPGFSIENFIELLDFGSHRTNLEIVYLPVSGHPRDLIRFFSRMSKIQPDLIWISPHGPKEASSWKIPLLLWLAQKLFWRKAKMAGIESEHLSFLFNVRLPVSRDLPLMEREQIAFSMLEDAGADALPWRISFVEPIQRRRDGPPTLDLVIHPGANAPNRRWPWEHFGALVRLLPRNYEVAVVGVPADIEQMRQVLPTDREIRFLTGTMKEAIETIASTRVLFSMDSGAAHFAKCLNVPAVSLFGKSDPASIIGYGGSVRPLYERKFPCQPCGSAVCTQPEVLCMNSIAPETVARALLALLEPDGVLQQL